MVRRAAILLPALLVAAACNDQPPPQPLPKFNGGTAVYDALSRPFGPSSPRQAGSHVVTVVSLDGDSARVVARVTFARRAVLPAPEAPHGLFGAQAVEPPYVSTSKDRIYALDGDSTIKEIGANGDVRTVMSLQVPAKVRAAFAVSPDGKKVAVALIDFRARWPAIGVKLFVQPLGGGPRTDLSLPNGFFWPVGWRDGQVVLATGSPYVSEMWNPNSASGYALLDAVPGARTTRITPHDCVPLGLPSAGGTACMDVGVTRCFGPVPHPGYDSCFWRLDWSGKQTLFSLPHVRAAAPTGGDDAALSPDGSAIVTSRLFLAGEGFPDHANQLGTPAPVTYDFERDVGWIDATHITAGYFNRDGTSGFGIIDLAGGQAKPNELTINGTVTGHLVATLPGGL